jgi:Transcriptional Coactivator p15 (PC4)
MGDLFKEPLGNNRFLTAGMNKDVLMVHIRQYDEGNGKLFPTRTGVFFTKARWATFLLHLKDIADCVQKLKAHQEVEYHKHIGGRYYVTINKGIRCVNIRRHFLPTNTTKERPTRAGIALRLSEWDQLLPKIEELHLTLPGLKDAKPCYSSLDHGNQLDYLSCTECNPFGLAQF